MHLHYKIKMYLNLVDEGGGKLIARRVHSDRDQGFGLVSNCFVLEHEVLASQLALSRDIVPQANGRVISAARGNNRALDGDIEARNRAIVEAAADEIELDLVVQVVALPDGLDVDDADVVVLHGDGQRLLIAVQGHAQDLLALRRRWLPSCNEVIMRLA